MRPSLRRDLAAAAELSNGRAARALLAERPSPGLVRAVATRADELRFEEPSKALDVARAALEAFSGLPATARQPALAGFIWAVYGSACRIEERFDECELALAVAAHKTAMSRTRARAGIARRLAYLRGIQKRGPEVRRLIGVFLEPARRLGGRQLGRDLVAAGSILILVDEFERAAAHVSEALTLIPPDGDRYHVSAVFNLARCRLELASTPEELQVAEGLIREVSSLIKTDSFNKVRLRWLAGNLLHRLRRFAEALAVYESVREGVEKRGNGYDRALLLLDLTELHLDRRDVESANAEARSSFGILSALRKETEAVKAMRVIYDAGASRSLDRATLRVVRKRLVALRP